MSARGRAALSIAWLAACGNDPSSAAKLEDMQFSALVDVDGNGLSHDDPVTTIRLADQLAAARPGTKILMVNAAAGWCDPCQREAAALSALRATYEPRGVAILTAVFQDPQGEPVDETFARTWAETFSLSVPVLIDTEFQSGAYFQANTMPANMFVDAETSEILLVATGAEPGDDPLRAYRELLDSYLAAR
jgi:thiol-disulfide isomerase/thioredoxin